MIYLLDTNALSDLIRGNEISKFWLRNIPEESSVITCPIVRGEILHGIGRLPVGKRRNELAEMAEQYLRSIPCTPIPAAAGDWYAAVKLQRERQGSSMDSNDLWIAATALALGATLVTRDTDFNGIEGLPVLAIQ